MANEGQIAGGGLQAESKGKRRITDIADRISGGDAENLRLAQESQKFAQERLARSFDERRRLQDIVGPIQIGNILGGGSDTGQVFSAEQQQAMEDLKRFNTPEAIELQNSLNTQVADATKEVSRLQSGDNRNADLARGAQFGVDLLGDGLTRLGEDQDTKDVLARFKGIADTGLSNADSVAQKERAFQNINQGTQTASRQLQASLGGRGVRGAVAGQQLADVQLAGLREKANVSRDLFINQESLKRAGLKDFANALGQVKTFDIGQESKELDIIQSAAFGFADIGQSERSAKEAAKAAQAAAAQSSGGGSSFLCSILRRFGLISQSESKAMTAVMLHGVKKYPKFLYWYFKNMKNTADIIESNNDPIELNAMLKTTVLNVLQQKGIDNQANAYIDAIGVIANRYNVLMPYDIKRTNIVSRQFYKLAIFSLSNTWKWLFNRITKKANKLVCCG